MRDLTEIKHNDNEDRMLSEGTEDGKDSGLFELLFSILI